MTRVDRVGAIPRILKSLTKEELRQLYILGLVFAFCLRKLHRDLAFTYGNYANYLKLHKK